MGKERKKRMIRKIFYFLNRFLPYLNLVIFTTFETRVIKENKHWITNEVTREIKIIERYELRIITK